MKQSPVEVIHDYIEEAYTKIDCFDASYGFEVTLILYYSLACRSDDFE